MWSDLRFNVPGCKTCGKCRLGKELRETLWAVFVVLHSALYGERKNENTGLSLLSLNTKTYFPLGLWLDPLRLFVLMLFWEFCTDGCWVLFVSMKACATEIAVLEQKVTVEDKKIGAGNCSLIRDLLYCLFLKIVVCWLFQAFHTLLTFEVNKQLGKLKIYLTTSLFTGC